MREVLAILGGIGAGAALMYLLDPDRGNRRRALIRDKVVKLNRQTQEAVSGRVKDVSNRAKGLLHEAKSAIESKEDTSRQQPATFS
jgi:gas vesicle protein